MWLPYFVVLFLPVALCSERLVCETSVKVPDPNGTLEIELWPATAPIGVRRIREMVDSGFFTDLPFFDVFAHQVMFGLQPDAAKQQYWDQMGDIQDDPFPRVHAEESAGLLCL